MVGDVLARFPERIVLLEDPQPVADLVAQPHDRMRRREAHILAEEIEEVVKTGVLDRHAAVQEAYPEFQRTVDVEQSRDRTVVEADGDGASGFAGEGVDLVVTVNDAQRTPPHDMAQ